MLRLTRIWHFSEKLDVGLAVGLIRDLPLPHWPLPLPPPLDHANASSKPRNTLVLDLDDTLLHTLHMNRSPDSKHLIHYRVLLRPHLKEFLREVNSLFEVVLWTAGVASYAAAMTNLLERVAGLPPSPIYDAVSCVASGGASTTDGSTASDRVSWYVLSRKQTLEEREWMKYLPLLGRDMKRCVLVDDNSRSFPLTPRQAVKCSRFEPNVSVMDKYYSALAEHVLAKPEAGGTSSSSSGADAQKSSPVLPHMLSKDARTWDTYLGMCRGDTTAAKAVADGVREVERLESDTGLLDLLPMLRSVAAAEDAEGELDFWRPDEYTMCDSLMDNMNRTSVARTGVLGRVTTTRRERAIPRFKYSMHPNNIALISEADQMRIEVWEAHATQREKRTKMLFGRGAPATL